MGPGVVPRFLCQAYLHLMARLGRNSLTSGGEVRVAAPVLVALPASVCWWVASKTLMGPMFTLALGAFRASWLKRAIVVPSGDVAIVIESIDESSKDGVCIAVINWRKFVQDKFLRIRGEHAKVVDGLLRQVPFAGEQGRHVCEVVSVLTFPLVAPFAV